MAEETTPATMPAPTATPADSPPAAAPVQVVAPIVAPPTVATLTPTVKVKAKNKAKTDYRAELEKFKSEMTAQLDAVKAQAEQTRQNSLKAAILQEAKLRGFIYPDDVLGKVNLADLELTEKGIKGLDKALDAVAKERPSWLQTIEAEKPAEPQKPAGRSWFGGGKPHDDGASKPAVKLNRGLTI